MYRFFEILPGAVSWTVLLGPLILARWFPRAAAAFVIGYVMIWFMRALKSSIFSVRSFFTYKKFEKIDWETLLNFFSAHSSAARTKIEQKTTDQIAHLKKTGQYKNWREIYHVVLIATYKEDKEILDSTLQSIAEALYPRDRLIVVLATEERDKARAEENSRFLLEKYGKQFGQFFATMHPDNLSGEIAAKGANISFAARAVTAELERQNIDLENVIVTTIDADNRPHPQYFSILTYHYLMQENRTKKSYQPLAFFHNNIWDVPFSNRVVALANTFWYLSESGERHRLFTYSAYAQSLASLKAMNFWSCQTVIEDLHQYWRAYFHFRGDHEVVPIFIPVYQDALQNRTYFYSLIGQYKQLRRWAWGASEVAYVATKMWRMRKELPFAKSLMSLWYLFYIQIMWATGSIIIFFNIGIATLFNPGFTHSIFLFNTGIALRIMFIIMIAGILVYIWLSLLSVPRPAGRFSTARWLSSVAELLLLPLVTIVYGSIPALDAQTRLMLGQKMGFGVTEKVRMKSPRG